jgi:trimeric autotransporter adhesin
LSIKNSLGTRPGKFYFFTLTFISKVLNHNLKKIKNINQVTTTNGIIPSLSTTGASNSHNHHHNNNNHTNITNHDTPSTNGTNNLNTSTTIENSKILPISDINSTNINTTKLNGTSTTTNNNNNNNTIIKQPNDVNKENIPITSTTTLTNTTTTTTTTTSPNTNRNIQKTNDSSISPTPLSQNIYSTTTTSNTNSSLTAGGGGIHKNDNQLQSKSPNFLNGASVDENTSASEALIDPQQQQITEITISNLNGSNFLDSYQTQPKSITPIPEIDSKENLINDLNKSATSNNANESSSITTTTTTTKLPLGQTMSLNAAATPTPHQTQPSSIPTPIQSNSRALSGSSTSSSVKPHQRGITHIGSGIGTNTTSSSTTTTTSNAGANAVRLKKSDTVRGTSDFPKSASTDKSRIESFISRNLPNSSLHTHQQDRSNNDSDAIRTSHSYRTKTELLQQNSNLPQHTAAAATVGTASLLASNSLSNNHNSVKSQSAAPIKQNENSASGSASSQKSDLRPRLEIKFYFSTEIFF